MSLAASNIIRLLCVVLPVTLFLVVKFCAARATEDLFGKTSFIATRADEISGLIVVACTLFVFLRVLVGWRVPLSDQYRGAFSSTAIQHAIVFLLASLFLDAGLTLFACCLAAIIFWMTVGIIVARRPSLPTSMDVEWVSLGFLIMAFITSMISWGFTVAMIPDR